jgi:hypothetical protein
MVMSKEVTVIKYCNWCGDPFEVKSPNQKYCPSGKKDCSKEAKRESWRKASNSYRNNYKNVLNISQVYKLGSGWLSSTPKNDFNEEYLAIQKEKKRLNINGIMVGVPLWVQMTSEFSMRNILQRAHFSIGELLPLLIALLVFLVFVIILGYYHK